MQFIQRTSRTTRKHKALRSILSVAAATLLLSGWASSARADIVQEAGKFGDAGAFLSRAQFIPSSAFTTPPPATVFGEFPTVTIYGGNQVPPGFPANFDGVDLYAFNAVAGQPIILDTDNASIPSLRNADLALFSGNGALLAYDRTYPGSETPDSGTALTYDPYEGYQNRDGLIGNYTLTYPNSNLNGTPIDSTLDPNRNTYYAAVFQGGRFGAISPTAARDPSAQGATTSLLTSPIGTPGGVAYNYSSLGYNVGTNNPDAPFGDGTNQAGSGLSPYVLNISLGPVGATAPVPEPGTMALMGLGIAGLAASRRRKKNKGEASAVVA